MALDQIIGSSRAASELRGLIRQAAQSDASVLILGESGTGKELVAQALHSLSNRHKSAFVPVNCGAIPKDLLESELFGHKKGAFTGAISDRIGRFELAHKGSLFLDEIGDMPLETQVKLLRVLQERSIDPIGSTRSVSVDVRVVAATHRDLEVRMENGEFREDLFYRLNVIPIILPALGERGHDIPELIIHFLKKFAVDGEASSFDSSLMKALCEYRWPGNIRELVNVIQRLSCFYPKQRVSLARIPSSLLPRDVAAKGAATAHVFNEGNPIQEQFDFALLDDEGGLDPVEETIMLAQGYSSMPARGVHLRDHLAEIEKTLIQQALTKAGGNVSQSARILNVQRTTLIEKINKYQLI